MEISLDIIQTVGLAVIVFIVGRWIKSKVAFFRTYFIPAPVIGGLLFSVLTFLGYQTGLVTLLLDTTLQDFFMNLFFTCIGFSVSVALIKRSGKLGAILAVISVIFLFIQNLVGVALSELFGINNLLGVAMGSISMSGGIGSAAAFGPTLEALGADNGTAVGIAGATFGLLVGCLIGGPVAKRLIDKNKLKSSHVANGQVIQEEEKKVTNIVGVSVLNSVMIVLLAAAAGSLISYLLNLTGLTFPYYVGCLFAGAIVRNVFDKQLTQDKMNEIDVISNVSVTLFLSMALMSLEFWKLIALAGPMFAILVAQALVVMVFAYFVTFRAMGKDYEAAVMAAGHCGVGIGQTPNAIANMEAVIEKHGPAPNAWFVLPVITVVFINIFNPVVITLFINIFS
ncbi:sodium/glutamate symporter [Alkalicoccobacillus murimartini]|uniref:Sodium/glutamate symporter n=1 Tax=Alkalicoccobacillus murimartini TaxID=171685 RepID=A0ABT9YE56_9BACI|nr:sodium/glutamate symporter [Alkalicoccobacillus murimartini]MDQ0206138.1 ESS family glutamate:Na+ symporter [Alkalicoccobacillus murimartini]